MSCLSEGNVSRNEHVSLVGRSFKNQPLVRSVSFPSSRADMFQIDHRSVNLFCKRPENKDFFDIVSHSVPIPTTQFCRSAKAAINKM